MRLRRRDFFFFFSKEKAVKLIEFKIVSGVSKGIESIYRV